MLSVNRWHAGRPFSKPITKAMHIHQLTFAPTNRMLKLRPNHLCFFQLGIRHTFEGFGVAGQLSS